MPKIKTDFMDRGIPWTELMLREGRMPDDLNAKVSRISVVLAYGLLISFGVAVWYYRQLVWMPLLLLVSISAFDYWSVQRRIPTVVRLFGALMGLCALALVGFAFKVWHLLPLALLVGIVAINFRFYAFYVSRYRRLLIFLLIPLHLLYYLYLGMAFVGTGLPLQFLRPATQSDVESLRLRAAWLASKAARVWSRFGFFLPRQRREKIFGNFIANHTSDLFEALTGAGSRRAQNWLIFWSTIAVVSMVIGCTAFALQRRIRDEFDWVAGRLPRE